MSKIDPNPQADMSLLKRSKFSLIRLVRRLGLLRLADTLRYQIHKGKVADENKKFLSEHPDFVPPPAELAYDAYNHASWPVYWESGYRHAQFFAETILKYSKVGKIDVLEWGCGPCRLIRHMPGLLGERAGDVSGTDYNPDTIDWCKTSVSGIRFELNGLMPPLPFPDNAFDAVYNFSVLTHLSSNVQIAWTQELYRVLKPGGVMVGTTHGENYEYMLASTQEKDAYARGDCVEQEQYAEGAKWYFAVHPEKFVREKLLHQFESVERVPVSEGVGMLQDVWVARKGG